MHNCLLKMLKVKLYKRYKNASLNLNLDARIKKNEIGKITPSKCPAIKQAYRLGCYINSPSKYLFQNGVFKVKRYKIGEKQLLDPGVIGDPTANEIFARIDSGYSFKNLEVEILATPILAPHINENIIIPPVVYPVGYTGPILIPLGSKHSIIIEADQPILQLIPLSMNCSFEEQYEELIHDSFEGLKYDSDLLKMILIDELNSLEYLK